MTNDTRATHNLADMLVLIRQGRYKTTKVAREGATRLGLDLDGMIAIVLDLPHSGFFYKTMESDKNPGLWMDVYHAVTPNDEDVYLKLMIQNGVLIVSFKEL
ncbi:MULTISPECIES: type II toxin-antitoxin system MqsR family toxin [unclassified Janthinobacterium]|uniref:type II toxin-antitoxin system MqsR family toxin n=1 Tax=unclassified Janthinobacterium TaxID=2610881 RepID=UPI0016126B42|nr:MULTISPECIES: type II toxin-antitoxin system MqsR family toxin [unclassified Janthinobacterium]MBB5610627.1 motility quorum-sensing regulator/GCU-specific mRNA interferase toxin [Janthinobacterium sp. S3T4]MBB5616113.1 motility quorum-sensing regulator/GCU-specific mRNA interferase toxin [Janthinobacterium sp. S3M3]